MKSVLEDLYFNSKNLTEKVKATDEYKKAQFDLNKLFENLLEVINDEQKEILEDLYSSVGNLEEKTGITYFKEGFKFCLKLFIEGLEK